MVRGTVQAQGLACLEYAEVTEYALLVLGVVVRVDAIDRQRGFVAHAVEPPTGPFAGHDGCGFHDDVLVEGDEKGLAGVYLIGFAASEP